MGLFYINTSDQNKLDKQKQHAEEINRYAQEALQIGQLADKSIFPGFLWEVQLNEHEGDDYKLRGTCNNPNVLKAYTIRRKYSNYWDYIDAMDAYIDYVNYIDSAYGSFDMMKNAADNGVSTIYIPKKPKLSNKKENKVLIRSGFTPSRIDEDFIPNSDVVDEAIRNMISREISHSKEYELPKKIQKLHEKEEAARVKFNRLNSIYATNSGSMQGMDAIINFLNNPNSDSVEDRGRTDSSFTEEMEKLHEYDHLPQDILDDMFTPKTTYLTSSYLMNPEKQREQEILMALTEAGYNFLDKAITSGLSKDAVRAVMRTYGSQMTNYDDLTPKQIKKLKKKEAKRRKHAKQRLVGDRRLADALLRNRAHLTRDSNWDFRISDVMPEDD